VNGWDQRRRDGGFRPYPYICTGGALTIGYGRNIDRDKGGPGLAEVEADFMLRNDVAACEIDLKAIFPKWDAFDMVRKGALINMRFQLGAGGFRGFQNMIKAINYGAWQMAANHALDSRWALQTPNRAMRVAEELRTGVAW